MTAGGQLDDDRARYGTDVANRSLLVFDSGDEIRVRAGDEGMRFLLVSGAPIREPVAWHGPVVMNTQEELPRRSRSCAPARSWISANGWEPLVEPLRSVCGSVSPRHRSLRYA